jgi:hypothetical protein
MKTQYMQNPRPSARPEYVPWVGVWGIAKSFRQVAQVACFFVRGDSFFANLANEAKKTGRMARCSIRFKRKPQ